MPPEPGKEIVENPATAPAEPVAAPETAPETPPVDAPKPDIPAQKQAPIESIPEGESTQLEGIESIAPAEVSETPKTTTSVASEDAPTQPAEETIPTATAPLTVQTVPNQQPANKNFFLSFLSKANEILHFRKIKKLDRILKEAEKKGHITNDEVEKLLHTSHATATRYLSQLVKEGKLQTNGKKGKAVEYMKA